MSSETKEPAKRRTKPERQYFLDETIAELRDVCAVPRLGLSQPDLESYSGWHQPGLGDRHNFFILHPSAGMLCVPDRYPG